MSYETIKKLKDTDFKRLTGVTPETYQMMLDVLLENWRNFGRSSRLSRADQLLMTLMYWREYRTQFHIAQSYGVSEATVSRVIRKVEKVLMASGQFSLPGRKALYDTETVIEVIVVDVTEQPIERPKKKQKQYYSGKKKRHTQKAQVVINQETAQVVATYFGKGHTHDFRLLKESRMTGQKDTRCLADLGYQGLAKLHANSEIPYKKSKRHPLTNAEKRANHKLSRRRILVENVIGRNR